MEMKIEETATPDTPKPIKVLSKAKRRTPLSAAQSASKLEEVAAFLESHKSAMQGISTSLRYWSPLMGPANPNMVAVDPELLQKNLDKLRTWRNQGLAYLQDLMAERAGIGPESQMLARQHAAQGQVFAQRLISELIEIVLSMAALESAAGRWHAAADAAEDAIRLYKEYGYDEEVGNPEGKIKTVKVGHLTSMEKAHLRLAFATFMLKGNSPDLRKQLAQSLKEYPRTAELAYWLARLEIMVGNYDRALDAIKNFDPASRGIQVVASLVDPDIAVPPWHAHPCNFYTYRRNRLDDASILALQDDITKHLHEEDISEEQAALADVQLKALDCISLWNSGNAQMESREFSNAISSYNRCQSALLAYFAARLPEKFQMPTGEGNDQVNLARVGRELIRFQPQTRWIWSVFRRRYAALSLEELYKFDWVRKIVYVGYASSSQEGDTALSTFEKQLGRLEDLDAFLLTLGVVFLPLAIAEVEYYRHNYDAALQMCRQLLRRHKEAKILSEFIEKPFIKILMARILLAKAHNERKAGTLANSPARFADGSLMFQGLKAAETYSGVLRLVEDQGRYVQLVRAAANDLADRLSAVMDSDLPTDSKLDGSHLPAPDTLDTELRMATVRVHADKLEEFGRGTGPHEPVLQFLPERTGSALRESNPLIYAFILQAWNQILKLENGFGYFGHPEQKAPQDRLHYAIAQASSASRHANYMRAGFPPFSKNLHRNGFCDNLVNQYVIREKACLQFEHSYYLNQQKSIAAILHSKHLYQQMIRSRQKATEMQPRDDSEKPARLTDVEAINEHVKGDHEAVIDQLYIAAANCLHAALDKTTAAVRHEFAVAALLYHRNQPINAELQMRLEYHWDSVADHYMHQAIAIAYATQRAFNWEYAQNLHLIRMDYQDIGEVIPDARLLHSHLQEIITAREDAREQMQKSRLTISLADDFPSEFAELISTGTTFFTLTPEYLAAKVPWRRNLRVQSVYLASRKPDTDPGAQFLITQLGISHPDPFDSKVFADNHVVGHVTGPVSDLLIQQVERVKTESSLRGLGFCATWLISHFPRKQDIELDELSDIRIEFTITGL